MFKITTVNIRKNINGIPFQTPYSGKKEKEKKRNDKRKKEEVQKRRKRWK